MAKSENPKQSFSSLPAYHSFSPKSPWSSDADLDPNSCSLEKFKLYETRAGFYLIGSDRFKRFFRVLKIDRSEPSELNISEDPVVYSPLEIKSLLQRIDEGNRVTGGLTFVGKVYGIVGCIKFLESYYLILVTKRKQIGCICGHAIYNIEESQLITVPHSSIQSDAANSKTELRYKKLLSSVDLTKDFFFSYTYPIMRSLQKNVLAMDNGRMPYTSIFVWNAFLTEAVRQQCNSTRWTIALVHGNFKQVKLSVFGREFSVCLISRRSRHFAGTRYLKRGVNDRGRVANDVETEQIVLDEEVGTFRGKMTSVVQMRGSIPLFWSQEASRFSPKPDIILQRYDPTYEATKLHFEDLANRYGDPIIVLNLIKKVEKRPREMMLRREFASAVRYLNQILPEEKQLKFIHWDFHKFAKTKSANVLAVLGAVASQALDLTGFYYSGKQSVKKRVNQSSRTSARASSIDLTKLGSMNEQLSSTVIRAAEKERVQGSIKGGAGSEPFIQYGVLRTNCIDCLDRTNVAQYAYGLAALGRQLHALGLADEPKVDPDSSIASALMDMYQSMGDALAQQYGGSAAHNTVFPERQGKWKATTQSREFLKSIKRYYSNAYTDGEKQDAINLFLGYFQPQEGKAALWELDSDYYLHVSGVNDELAKSDGDSLSSNEMPTVGSGINLCPMPACKEDFFRTKLTSFDKLIEKTCSSLRNVRLGSEPDVKVSSGISGVAPDAVEIQLKSPNWLFGQRKYEDSTTVPKYASHNNTNAMKSQEEVSIDRFCELGWLFSGDECEEDIFQRYLAITSGTDGNGWCNENLLFGQDETSEIYQHYAELCQGPTLEPFQDDSEKEKHYAEVLKVPIMESADDSTLESEMEAALKEYELIGADLGISAACSSSANDPSRLTRWIIGDEVKSKGV